MDYTSRQREIIEIALRLLASGGLRNLTMKRIADALGVSEPAVYRHFRNKSEVIKGVINRFDLSVDFGDGGGFAPVAAFIRARVAQVEASPDLSRVVFSEELFMAEGDFAADLRGMMHRHRDLVVESLRAGRARGEIRADIGEEELFRIIMGPVRLLIKQWGLSGGGFDLRQKSEELLNALEKMLLLKKEE